MTLQHVAYLVDEVLPVVRQKSSVAKAGYSTSDFIFGAYTRERLWSLVALARTLYRSR